MLLTTTAPGQLPGQTIKPKMKTTVIYHSADYDGIFCREIARKFLGEKDVEFIGWNYGDELIRYPDDGAVLVMDLSPECFKGLPHRAVETLTWIDHHKTAIEKFSKDIQGYRIDGVAACRLAWQWFSNPASPFNAKTP